MQKIIEGWIRLDSIFYEVERNDERSTADIPPNWKDRRNAVITKLAEILVGR